MSTPAERALTSMDQIMLEAEKLQDKLVAIQQRSRDINDILSKIDVALTDLDVQTASLKQKALQLIVAHLEGKE